MQSRPITTLGPEEPAAGPAAPGGALEPLLTGLAASPGIVSGRVRVLHTVEESRALEPGEVLVAPMTTPDWVPTIRRAAALVTDGGGMTCHAAIVSRELGVPCVVGTRRRHATRCATASSSPSTAAAGAIYEGDQIASTPRRAVTVVAQQRRAGGQCARGRSPPASTSTWRSPTTPRRSPPCRSTAWACCGPSS